MEPLTVMTIGNFDGVHHGHRAILGRARQEAQRRGARVRVLTFEPHPIHLLRPGTSQPRLVPARQRLKLLRQAGADDVVVMAPTMAWLSQTPEQFVAWLREAHQPVAVVEGIDFHFGYQRQGNMNLLRELGRQAGFEVVAVEKQRVMLSDGTAVQVSSSLVRDLISAGRVEDAGRCLGRAFTLGGQVVRGEQRGRTIGFPTLNLQVENGGGGDDADRQIVPGDGVYAGHVMVHEPRCEDQWLPAAISVGVKPTFGNEQRVVEAYILDFDRDIYDRSVTVRFDRRLREQVRFADVEALQAQLHEDVEKVRAWLKDVAAGGGAERDGAE